MKRIVELLLAGIIFLVPSNLFYHFFTEVAYNRGLFIDYLLPKIYLSDIFLVGFIVCFFLWKRPTFNIKKIPIITTIFVVCLILRQFFVENILASVMYLGHALLITIFGICLFKTPELYTSKLVRYAFLVTVLFQSLLGIYQFYFQHSLYGYRFLGEPAISRSIGIAHDIFGSTERALPYGTTAHPNVLAGILVVYLTIAFLYLKNKKNNSLVYHVFLYCSLPFVFTTLWFTQSISAFLAVLLVTIIFTISFLHTNIFIRKKMGIGIFLTVFILTPLLLNYFEAKLSPDLSISRRVTLNTAALTMLLQNIFVGVGLNQFTVQLENYTHNSEVVRFVQPAHHIGLLWLAETGLLGLLTGGLVLFKSLQKASKINLLFLAFLPMMVLDHYLLTIQSGMLLLPLAIFFIRSEE